VPMPSLKLCVCATTIQEACQAGSVPSAEPAANHTALGPKTARDRGAASASAQEKRNQEGWLKAKRAGRLQVGGHLSRS